MKAVIYGTNGALACALAKAFTDHGWTVDQVARDQKSPTDGDVYVFPQGSFIRKPFNETTPEELCEQLDGSQHAILNRLKECLPVVANSDTRCDYVIIGSTSSYEGFAGSSIYCMVKHGLLGLVRALNKEYKNTNRRFWLFSMGTMDTPMGRQLTDQDPSTFLSPDDVAQRIVETVTNRSNLFEPEVIIRRRHVA